MISYSIPGRQTHSEPGYSSCWRCCALWSSWSCRTRRDGERPLPPGRYRSCCSAPSTSATACPCWRPALCKRDIVLTVVYVSWSVENLTDVLWIVQIKKSLVLPGSGYGVFISPRLIQRSRIALRMRKLNRATAPPPPPPAAAGDTPTF